MKHSQGQRSAVIVTALLAVCAVSFCGGFFTKSAVSSGKSASYTVLTAEEASASPALPQEALDPDETPDVYIDINTAGIEELSELNGIGEKLAERIIEYRELNGPFIHRYDIMNVSGIGSGIYEKIKNNIYVTS